MEKVGVRDLKIHASEIVRRLREEQETIELTYRGETVGKIVPMEPRPSQQALDESLGEWNQLAQSIHQNRIDKVSAEETIKESRRTL